VCIAPNPEVLVGKVAFSDQRIGEHRFGFKLPDVQLVSLADRGVRRGRGQATAASTIQLDGLVVFSVRAAKQRVPKRGLSMYFITTAFWGYSAAEQSGAD
jgi:hypothetical protein